MKRSRQCDACEVLWIDEEWYHQKDCPEGKKLRDSWCTPEWLCTAMGQFTLDPCSNPWSEVLAKRHLLLERNENGLEFDWKGHDVFINGPYSNLLPWAFKAVTARSAVALVNTDHSTKWFKAFVKSGLCYELRFHKRIQFDPPPHILPSTNNKCQSLLCTWEAAIRIDRRVSEFGTWWAVSESLGGD